MNATKQGSENIGSDGQANLRPFNRNVSLGNGRRGENAYSKRSVLGFIGIPEPEADGDGSEYEDNEFSASEVCDEVRYNGRRIIIKSGSSNY